MNILIALILGLIGIILIIIIIWIVLNWREIHSFFRPGLYNSITMLELDDNVSSWLQKKNSDLRFEFNNGYYNMFHRGDIQGIKIPPKFTKNSVIYREGRLGKFFYVEGNADPIDFRKIESTHNPQLSKEIEKTQFSRLFESPTSFGEDLLQKYGFFILLGIGALVLFMILGKGG